MIASAAVRLPVLKPEQSLAGYERGGLALFGTHREDLQRRD